jgi:hypothetical protein
VRLRLASLVLLFFSAVACHKESPPRPDHPRLTPNVRMQDVTFHSASLERDMPYRVILPVSRPIRNCRLFISCMAVGADIEIGRITRTWRDLRGMDSFL